MQITEEMQQSNRSEYSSGQGEEKRGGRKRWKPSPTAWRTMLNSGDTLMLAASSLLCVQFGLINVSAWNMFFLLCMLVASWNIAANVTEAYNLVHASSHRRSILSIFLSLSLTALAWALLLFPFMRENQLLSFAALSRFVGVTFALLTLWRFLFASCINLRRFHQRSVILGVNETGEAVARELRDGKGFGLNLLGYIDETETNRLSVSGLPILGGREALCRLAASGGIDTIIMALDYRANAALFQEALNAAQLGVAVMPITAMYERTLRKLPVEHIGDQWYLSLPSEKTISLYYLCWQKIVDLIFGLLGLVALALTFLIVAPLIWLSSPGPIFYTQERLGYQGRTFRIYKFRSMYTETGPQAVAQWTEQNDRRVTPIGAFLRATHLDELPQMLNILRGDMTLIGPRPERPEFVSSLEQTIPFYRCRLSVKPGLTGWAQVKYHYGNTTNDALVKLQYDLYYIKHRSFMLDVLIILRTVMEVVFLRGL